jgi:hypothetical protein
LLKKKEKDLHDSSVQCERYNGDQSYLQKQYGKHIFDFGQKVDEVEIKRCYQIVDLLEKNKRMMCANPPEKTSPTKKKPLSISP